MEKHHGKNHFPARKHHASEGWRSPKIAPRKMPNVTSGTHRKWCFWLLFGCWLAAVVVVLVFVLAAGSWLLTTGSLLPAYWMLASWLLLLLVLLLLVVLVLLVLVLVLLVFLFLFLLFLLLLWLLAACCLLTGCWLAGCWLLAAA